jgi:hypothetical protein
MGALGWDEQCAELTTRGQGQRPGATCYAEPSVVVGQAEQQRLRGVERADDPAHDSVGGGSGPDLAPGATPWPVAVLAVFDHHPFAHVPQLMGT